MLLDSIEEYASVYDCDLEHSQNVRSLAIQLFDVSPKLHGLGETERRLLGTAALLHDIGWEYGQSRHHKNSARMILENPPSGLTERELLIVANVARYHRKALPTISHVDYARLASADRETVDKLAALLRIADGLDVTHDARVSIENFAFSKQSARLRLSCAGEPSPSIDSANKKADLFERVFQRRLLIEPGRVRRGCSP